MVMLTLRAFVFSFVVVETVSVIPHQCVVVIRRGGQDFILPWNSSMIKSCVSGCRQNHSCKNIFRESCNTGRGIHMEDTFNISNWPTRQNGACQDNVCNNGTTCTPAAAGYNCRHASKGKKRGAHTNACEQISSPLDKASGAGFINIQWDPSTLHKTLMMTKSKSLTNYQVDDAPPIRSAPSKSSSGIPRLRQLRGCVGRKALCGNRTYLIGMSVTISPSGAQKNFPSHIGVFSVGFCLKESIDSGYSMYMQKNCSYFFFSLKSSDRSHWNVNTGYWERSVPLHGGIYSTHKFLFYVNRQRRLLALTLRHAYMYFSEIVIDAGESIWPVVELCSSNTINVKIEQTTLNTLALARLQRLKRYVSTINNFKYG